MPARALAPATVPQTYAELRRAVELTLFQGQREIELARVRTYHETGRLIHEHILLFKHRADYGSGTIQRLADDLKTHRSQLQRCVQFFQTVPNCATRRNLTWSHYKLLFPVTDPKLRSALADRANREEWPATRLREEIQARLPAPVEESSDAPPAQVFLLKPKRGRPGFYPVVNRPDGLALDLGFKVYLPLAFRPEPSLQKLSAGNIVHADADHAPALAPDATKADLYTYRTSAVRVVDGDTLAVTIDLPPFNRLDKKLRLRGLNCPEMDTDAGKAAKRYVQSLVDRADEVVITTTKPDKYDRYLADVFLLGLKDDNSAVTPRSELQANSSGLFLNNSLLANGHAVPMGDDAQPVVS